MLSSRERYLQHHELIVSSSPAEAPTIPLKQLLSHLKNAFDSGVKIYKTVEKDTAVIRLADFSFEKHFAVFLVQYGDSNVSDPTFMELLEGKVRKHKKKKGEGIAYSAHVVVAVQPFDKIRNRYRFVIEEVPGLGRSKVTPFLHYVFRQNFPETRFKDPFNDSVEKLYKPSIDSAATPNQKVVDDIQNGGSKLNYIELEELHPETDFDEDGYYRSVRRSLRLKVESNFEPKKIVRKLIDNLKGGDEFTDPRVRLVYRNVNGKSRISPGFRPTQAELAESMVVRIDKELLTSDIEQCQTSIHSELASRMIRLLD